MENNILIPIDVVEVRSAGTKKAKYSIRGKARLIPGKQYSYMFKQDKDGNPVKSLKEVFSPKSWDKIKKKILSKQIFVDESHKTVAALNIERFFNDLSRETGKNFQEYKSKVLEWMKVSEMPLFKLNDVAIEDDSIGMDIEMNPYFRDIDSEHAAYFDSVWNSLEGKYINSISLNFNPTEVEKQFDAQGKEFIPVIHDIDVYGISLLSGPAYDDMYDVLDVSIRAAQTRLQTIEKSEENGTMSEETKQAIKKEVKMEIKEETLKEENEKLKREIKEKESLIKAKEEEQNQIEREAEKQAMIDEHNRLKSELEEKNRMLQAKSIPSKGLVPPVAMNEYNARKEIKQILEPISEERQGNGNLGKMIILQAEYNGLKTLSPETQYYAQQMKADLVARRAKV